MVVVRMFLLSVHNGADMCVVLINGSAVVFMCLLFVYSNTAVRMCLLSVHGAVVFSM